MTITVKTGSQLGSTSGTSTANEDRPVLAPAPSKKKDYTKVEQKEVYARAQKKMRLGKRLVIGGFVVAIVGIVGYCLACLSAGIHQDLGATFLENPGWLVGSTLGVIGLGTLLWLLGSFTYLSGAMDSDPDGPDLYF